jgi:hypothetical protein
MPKTCHPIQSFTLSEHIGSDRVHRLVVIVRLKEVSVAVHRHLQAAMAGEGLHRLRAQTRLDPTRYGEVP